MYFLKILTEFPSLSLSITFFISFKAATECMTAKTDIIMEYLGILV